MVSPFDVDAGAFRALPPCERPARFHRRIRRRAGAVAIVLAGALILALLIGFAIRSRTTSRVASPPLSALTVTTTVPRRTVWATTLVASGAIFPWQEASVGTRIGSYQVTEVRANVGDHVRKGETLARLDQSLLRADEMQLTASYEQAEANRQRAVSLRSTGGISEQDVLQAVTQARTTAALLAAKRLQLRYTDVTAPDDGVVNVRTATLGAVVPAGQELFRIIRRSRLEWRGELTAAQIAAIAPGQIIALTLPDGTRAAARTRVSAPAFDGQSRLGLVYADILTGSRARAGMYAKGQIAIGRSPALVVPAESVAVRDGLSYVFTVPAFRSTASVMARPVDVGRREGGEVEINRGLAGSERVVVAGAGFLSDGDQVRIVDRPAWPERAVGAAAL